MDANRTWRGGNPGGSAVSPAQKNGSPPQPFVGPQPSADQGAADANRAWRGSNSAGTASTPAARNITPPPTVTPPAASVNKNPLDTKSNIGPRNFSPATMPQPKAFTPNGDLNRTNGLQAQRDNRPSLSDTRKRLDQRKSDPPTVPSGNQSGSKTFDKPAGKPGGKTFDIPNKSGVPQPLPGKKIDLPNKLGPPPLPGKKVDLPNKIGPQPLPGKTFDIPNKSGGPQSLPGKKVDLPNKIGPQPLPGNKTDLPNKLGPQPLPGKKIDLPNKLGPQPLPGKMTDLPNKLGPQPLPGNKTDLPNKLGPQPLPGNKTDLPNKLGPQPLPSGRLPQNIAKEDLQKQRGSLNHKRFDERLKSGELDAVAKGDVARKLNLADQYKHMQKGDVARRMDLQKHTAKIANVAAVNNVTVNNLKGLHPHHGFHCGTISPVYVNNCFKFHYYGHSFFAGACWYPHWNPWVRWSWGYHCNPIWDPRPIWCRPVIYQPYIVWNWWAPPVWQPLPEAVCGTWVDVKPIVVEPEQFDLQLLAVRMVDPGHPEEKLGPRYRVWFRNNGNRPIAAPFTVMLFASNDRRFGPDLPRGGVRVTSIEAGDTQSVDIRLPIEVATMNRDAAGQPAPFEFLHFFVDANREVNDVNLDNNGAAVPRAEMLPVDPAAFEVDPAQGQAGGEIIIAGEGFGPQPGQVLLHVGDREIQAEIVGWYDLGVKFNVPKLDIALPVEAEAIVVRGDGAAANPLRIKVLPGFAVPEPEFPAEK